jgi:molecular chaperone IbpA
MAVAGFSSDDLAITVTSEELTVCGKKPSEDASRYLHRGIAARSFKRRFELAPFIKVQGARLGNGLLWVDLRREPPEETRRCRINIVCGGQLRSDLKGSGPAVLRPNGTCEPAPSGKRTVALP